MRGIIYLPEWVCRKVERELAVHGEIDGLLNDKEIQSAICNAFASALAKTPDNEIGSMG